MDNQQMVESESARQNCYQAFARCYHLPTQSLKKDLQVLQKDLGRTGSEALPYLNDMILEMKQIPLDVLSVDFTRLFVGPYSLPAPPYGSVYLENERKVMGDSTMTVLRFYRRFGLDIAEGLKEVPDHITIELEFMYFLIYKEIESILSNDLESSQLYIKEQLSFLADHLDVWAPQFTGNIIEFSGTEFYRNLGKATRLFIKEDCLYLNNVCKKAALK
tara:strand:+ start:651 stop:1304 length:654 start_codon:yes stop_codon:yes gene_type:complete